MDQLVSIVIPVYNTSNSLGKIASQIQEVFQESLPQFDFEIIFVDDGSPNDSTWVTLFQIAVRSPKIKAIRLMRNFGQQAATICGLERAIGQYIITMDDDMQHSPYDIPELLKQKNHDVVIGQFSLKKHSFFKRLMSRAKGYFDRVILSKPKGIQLSAFRLINQKTLRGINSLNSSPHPFIPAMIFHVTNDVVGVNVNHYARNEGTTGYNLKKLIKIFSNLMINNSFFLLRLIGKFGILIAILSFCYSLFLIYRRIFDSITLLGWTSVMVVLLFIGGLLLFSIGVIGEYLIRLIEGVDQKPNYLIRDEISKSKNK